jgi:lipopolysaccharide/colanic/teichoic acid biosynthesis glycosyltransferase/glycosyltransferase involved in cell wall biosynthesis
MRGGERVVEALYGVFPEADLFTLTWDPERLSPALAQRRARTSIIDSLTRAPWVNGRFRGLLPLFPLAVESFRLDPYSLVVSSSHCVAIGALAPPRALHLAYVHSTLRYVREAQNTYEARVPGGAIGKALFRGTAHYLRTWEAAAAARPHLLIANSTYTRDRIRTYYQRDAQIIAPPIDTGRFERAAATATRLSPDAPFLMVSALVPNKRVDLALRAFQGRDERLIVVGEGPERARIEHLAGPNVTLLPRVDEDRLASLYAGCKALIHTGVDDFGMVMVEALAAGKPVIACAQGGALDIVRDGETGLLIETPTVDAVRAALDRFGRTPGGFDPGALQKFARRFDRANFERRFLEAVEEARRQRHDTATNGRMHPNGTASTNGTTRTNGATHANGVHPTNGTMHANGSALTHGANHSNGASRTNGTANADRTNGTHRAHNGTASVHLPIVSVSNGSAPAPAAKPNAHPLAIDPLTVEGHLGLSAAGLAAKRLLDVTLAASGLVLTAPLIAALAAVIPLDSRGSAFFYQRRIGLYQRPFTMIKLRTMDAHGRVTRLGRALRPTGLDELPQLWNVLKGEMSLIGPRPEVIERVVRFENDLPGFGTRHLVRPGITGWAQVNGLRGNVSIAERLQFDIQYLRERSLALDGRILVRTVSTVLSDTIRELRG